MEDLVNVSLPSGVRVDVGEIGLALDEVDLVPIDDLRAICRTGALIHRMRTQWSPGERLHGGLAVTALGTWLLAHGVDAVEAARLAWGAVATSRRLLASAVEEAHLGHALGELWTALEAVGALAKPRARWRRPPIEEAKR